MLKSRPKKITKRTKLKRFVISWVLALALTLGLAYLASLYVSFDSFRDATFGARDEKSLLALTPTVVSSNSSSKRGGISVGTVFLFGDQYTPTPPVLATNTEKVAPTATALPSSTPVTTS